MALELWFDPETGEASAGRWTDRWQVICDGDSVSLLADTDHGKHVLIGSATWNGTELDRRYEVDKPIAASTWGKLEHALRAAQGNPAPAEPAPRRTMDYPTVQPPLVAPSPPARDTRSGWWALAAFLVALAGFLASWLAHVPGDGVSLWTTIALGTVTVFLGGYTAYGAGTRCPSCKAWYRRETTSIDNLGSHTETRQESKPIYDHEGKQTGTTSETVTYTVTQYRYNYRCKECSRRWTGSGSSESRG